MGLPQLPLFGGSDILSSSWLDKNNYFFRASITSTSKKRTTKRSVWSVLSSTSIRTRTRGTTRHRPRPRFSALPLVVIAVILSLVGPLSLQRGCLALTPQADTKHSNPRVTSGSGNVNGIGFDNAGAPDDEGKVVPDYYKTIPSPSIKIPRGDKARGRYQIGGWASVDDYTDEWKKRKKPKGGPPGSMSSYTDTLLVEPEVVVSRCQCKQLEVRMVVADAVRVTGGGGGTGARADAGTSAVDCHCPHCRKFHVAAFASYLVVPASEATIVGDTAESYRDYCDELGAVERVYCGECYSKLLTRPVDDEADQEESNRPKWRQRQWQPDNSRRQNKVLVNMGPIDDRTIPSNFASIWRSNRGLWQYKNKASWTDAKPNAGRGGRSSGTGLFNPHQHIELQSQQQEEQQVAYGTGMITGGCSCGKSRYRIQYDHPTELQHCYCRLCRRVSGGPFMTWIPVYDEDMEWLVPTPETASVASAASVPLGAAAAAHAAAAGDSHSTADTDDGVVASTRATTAGSALAGSAASASASAAARRRSAAVRSALSATSSASAAPPLVRMTGHGRRHICPDCGGVLTIVYDDQPGITWPAAGGIDDGSVPTRTDDMSRRLDSVIHICCRYKQNWYQLPRDGLPRVREAS